MGSEELFSSPSEQWCSYDSELGCSILNLKPNYRWPLYTIALFTAVVAVFELQTTVA
jgi:hypothetical protein